MSTTSKVLATHRARQAVVYVRQSSPQQVVHHLESQQRQYALRSRLTALGWSDAQCVVIDDDLGISAARSDNRPGYQRLVSMLALRLVGIVIGIDVSRLARNCRDWYQLLELASAFGVLIADEDAVYDPADFNDRLLLGLKGTISEAELYQIKCRMQRGRLHKARRGALEIPLPIGYERGDDGGTRKTPDVAVRTALETVFALFTRLRSVRGVLRALRARGAQLPHWHDVPGLERRVAWRAPTYDALYNMLRNPSYAGVYVYGRRRSHVDPVRGTRRVAVVAPTDWEIAIPDHHEGYVSREQYDEHQATLRNNAHARAMSQGAPREGAALLQGLVYCKRCGIKMRPRYTHGAAYYTCDREHQRRGAPICGRASAARVDAIFEDLFLDVLSEGTVDLTFALAQRQRSELTALRAQWDQTLARVEYAANLARRRYEAVDPDNRLVAGTLEAEWNVRLAEVETTRAEIARRFPTVPADGLAIDAVKAAVRALPARWRDGAIAVQDKKELIRTLVERVHLDPRGKVIRVEVAWHGGTLTDLDVPKYLFTSHRIYARVVALARERTDGEIAAVLNAEGLHTVKGRPWTTRRVMDFRLSNAIASCFTTRTAARVPASGFVASSELAATLGVVVTTIQHWYHLGVLEGRQAHRQAKLWIRIDEATLRRLDGSAAADATTITLRRLMRTLGGSQKQAIAWAHAHGHEVLRLRRGKSFQFYVRPGPDPQGPSR